MPLLPEEIRRCGLNRASTPKRATAARDSGMDPRDLKGGRLANFTPEAAAELRAELVEDPGPGAGPCGAEEPASDLLSGAGAAREAVATCTSSSIRSRPSIAY
jgi:hypothetical protein